LSSIWSLSEVAEACNCLGWRVKKFGHGA